MAATYEYLQTLLDLLIPLLLDLKQTMRGNVIISLISKDLIRFVEIKIHLHHLFFPKKKKKG